MNATSQTVKLDEGDTILIKMPTGEEITVGFGGIGQVPAGKPWIITAANNNERGFTLTRNGKLKEYTLL